MDAEFWRERWMNRQIAFDEGHPNELLARHFSRLQLKQGSRVFVPLCGKAVDLKWIAGQGHRVVGIELSQLAVKEFAEDMNTAFDVVGAGDLICYQFDSIDIFVGDIFEITTEALGRVDAIYDRAALVALPRAMRRAYASQLISLTATAPQLLVGLDYDQAQTEGPPFSVGSDEIADLYRDRYDCELIDSVAISGPLADRCSGTENAYLLSARNSPRT